MTLNFVNCDFFFTTDSIFVIVTIHNKDNADNDNYYYFLNYCF